LKVIQGIDLMLSNVFFLFPFIVLVSAAAVFGPPYCLRTA
jgi:hypothetical protein